VGRVEEIKYFFLFFLLLQKETKKSPDFDYRAKSGNALMKLYATVVKNNSIPIGDILCNRITNYNLAAP
jgi:hypothetical protein